MRVLQWKRLDVANGPGLRTSVFVSGCRIRCPGCFQPQSWNFRAGRPLGDVLDAIVDSVGACDGLSVLGGEPLEPANQPGVRALLDAVRARWPSTSVWLWTGCSWDRLVDGGDYRTADTRPLLSMVDVLVEGPFVRALADPGLAWRGSSNQRLLAAGESVLEGRPVLAGPDLC